MMKRWIQVIVIIGMVGILIVGCSNQNSSKQTDADGNVLTDVSFVLDWTPNTNHTGVYVAIEKGYYEEAGLAVEVMLPGEVQAEQLLATGKGDFGVSFQSELTQARAEGLDVVSVAAIIQHNTSGYAAPVDKGITNPKEFEGKTYGAYGSSLEEAKLQAIMAPVGGNAEEVSTIMLRDSDYFAAVEREIDFASIFYAWTGIEAELRGIELDMIYFSDYVNELDSYEPLIATGEKLMKDDPDTVSAFIEATAKGYEFAIEHPDEAAAILLDHVPDLDEELVVKSQAWLADEYQADADQWGLQETERWDLFTNFLLENNIIEKSVDAEDLFTNDFLP